MNFIRAAVLALVLATGCSITALLAEDVTPKESVDTQEVLPLPGGLSDVPMFNSNNPEVVQSEGILLSTLSPTGKANPAAHLDYTFDKALAIFSHHIARPFDESDKRTLYQAILVHNPGAENARIVVTSGASYLSQPDSPFIQLPAMVPNPRGKVFAGPGSRIADDVLRGKHARSKQIKRRLTIKPGQTLVLAKLAIPVGNFTPPLNGRSTLANVQVEQGKVQVADVAAFSTFDGSGKDVAPGDEKFVELLNKGDVAGPREKPASAPGAAGAFAYGRVAGVSQGTAWQSAPGANALPISNPGGQFSLVVSALERGAFGNGQNQAAPLLVRYPDSAYRAHGNYALYYDLVLPLQNLQSEPRDVEVLFQTPLKTDKLEHGLKFADPPYKQIFFRGTVRVTYPDPRGKLHSQYFHLVQHRGERGTPLATVHVPAGAVRAVGVQFVYPPDATPPQVITVRTAR